MTTWEESEARRFLEFSQSDRLAVAWALFLTRGLRRGELCGLTWPDVNFDAQQLAITTTRVVVDGKAVGSSTKNGKGRSVPLDADLIGLLRRHHNSQKIERLAAGPAYDDQG